VPADLLLLCPHAAANSDQSKEIYIKTDQLDGESDWKQRVSAYDTF